MSFPRRPYHRDYLVIALAARTYSRLDREQVIEDVDNIIASFPFPLSKPLLLQKFRECLHGERLAQVNAKSEQRERAA